MFVHYLFFVCLFVLTPVCGLSFNFNKVMFCSVSVDDLSNVDEKKSRIVSLSPYRLLLNYWTVL